MQHKVVDFAPRRPRRQRRFRELLPGIAVLLLCLLIPAELPRSTAAASLPVDGYVISPVPTVNQSVLPTIPLSEKQAGDSADERLSGSSDGDASSPKRSIAPAEPAEPAQIIQDVFGADAPMALAIAQAESSLDCSAHSETNDGGLFQISLGWHLSKFNGESPYDCLANAKVAKAIYDAQGWSPWVTYLTGAYRRYL